MRALNWACWLSRKLITFLIAASWCFLALNWLLVGVTWVPGLVQVKQDGEPAALSAVSGQILFHTVLLVSFTQLSGKLRMLKALPPSSWVLRSCRYCCSVSQLLGPKPGRGHKCDWFLASGICLEISRVDVEKSYQSSVVQMILFVCFHSDEMTLVPLVSRQVLVQVWTGLFRHTSHPEGEGRHSVHCSVKQSSS